jgi:hypothetical protein
VKASEEACTAPEDARTYKTLHIDTPGNNGKVLDGRYQVEEDFRNH